MIVDCRMESGRSYINKLSPQVIHAGSPRMRDIGHPERAVEFGKPERIMQVDEKGEISDYEIRAV